MSATQITQLLIALRGGQRQALNDLLPLVYDQLLVMAHHKLGRADRAATLDTVSLVHEAYLKLFDSTKLEWNDRKHFFAVVAMAMRQIVVDQARRRASRKRGGDLKRVELNATALAIDEQAEELVALDQALTQLSRLDERLARVVELKFFFGFSTAEVADALGIAERTVERDWRTARAVLLQAMAEDTVK